MYHTQLIFSIELLIHMKLYEYTWDCSEYFSNILFVDMSFNGVFLYLHCKYIESTDGSK